MSEASKNPFPYPLQLGALECFCHPADGHLFSATAFYAGQALATNGYIAIRADRGLWMESDFVPAPDGFLTRFLGLPWGDVSAVPAAEWRAMDEVRAHLFKFGPRELWKNNRAADSPVVRVGPQFLARLSHLQLLARLPRCEVVSPSGRATAMVFRFAGGQGILGASKKFVEQETEAAFTIFKERYCPVDGTLLKRSPQPNFSLRPPPPEEPPFPDWPPAEVD